MGEASRRCQTTQREKDIHFAMRVLIERHKQQTFNAYTSDTDPNDAIQHFTAKFGKEPEVCEIDSGVLMVGPVER